MNPKLTEPESFKQLAFFLFAPEVDTISTFWDYKLSFPLLCKKILSFIFQDSSLY